MTKINIQQPSEYADKIFMMQVETVSILGEKKKILEMDVEGAKDSINIHLASKLPLDIKCIDCS